MNQDPVDKICTKCNIKKSLQEFAFEKGTNSYRTQCRNCRNIRKVELRDIKNAKIQVAKNLLPKPEPINEKKCTRCLLTKTIDNFYKSSKSTETDNKFVAVCSPCRSEYEKVRRVEVTKKHTIIEDIIDTQICNFCNVEKPIDTYLRHDNGTRRKECADCRKQRSQLNNAYIKADPKLNKEYNAKKQLAAKILLDKFPEKKIMRANRKKLHAAFKTGGEHSELIGCDEEFLGIWFEFHYSIDTDLNYDNYGKVWHIDHVIPCNVFDINIKSEKQQCFHWSNLMPLLVADNLKKGAKINNDSIAEQNKRLHKFCTENCIDVIQISPPLSQQPLHKLFEQKLTLNSRNMQDISIAGTSLTQSKD